MLTMYYKHRLVSSEPILAGRATISLVIVFEPPLSTGFPAVILGPTERARQWHLPRGL